MVYWLTPPSLVLVVSKVQEYSTPKLSDDTYTLFTHPKMWPGRHYLQPHQAALYLGLTQESDQQGVAVEPAELVEK